MTRLQRCISVGLYSCGCWCLAALAGCSGQAAKDATSTITKEVVEVGKGAVTGIQEGVAQGRKSAASPDDAIIVTNGKEMADVLKVEILAVRKSQFSDVMEVDVGLANSAERPVRLTGLSGKNVVLLLDKDGYVSEPSGTLSDEITIPERAKSKQTFQFPGDHRSAHKIRIHGQDIAIMPDKIQQ